MINFEVGDHVRVKLDIVDQPGGIALGVFAQKLENF